MPVVAILLYMAIVLGVGSHLTQPLFQSAREDDGPKPSCNMGDAQWLGKQNPHTRCQKLEPGGGMVEVQDSPLEMCYLCQHQVSQQMQRHRDTLPQVPIGVGEW